MPWEEIAILFSGLVRIEFAIIELCYLNINPVQVFFITAAWSNIHITFIFYFTGLLSYLMQKSIILATGKNQRNWLEEIWRKKVREPIEQRKQKVIQWLLAHNKLIIFLVILCPFSFLLDSIAVIATKLTCIRHGLLLILAANTGRVFIVTLAAYHFL